MSVFSANNSLAGMRQKLAALNSVNTKQASPHKYAVKEKRAKLKAILKELKKGNHVQNRMLKTWLTEDEYESLGQLQARILARTDH